MTTPLTLAQVRHYLDQVGRVHGPDVPVRVAPPAVANGCGAPRHVALVDLLLALEDGRPVVLLVPGPAPEGGGQ